VYDILKEQILQQRRKYLGVVRVTITSRVRQGGLDYVLEFYGADRAAVSKLKAQLANLAAGKILLNAAGSATWHRFFVGDDGLNALRQTIAPDQRVVLPDKRKCELVYHGPQRLFEATRRAILEKVPTRASTYRISLETDEKFRKASQGGFRRVIDRSRPENVTLEMNPKRQLRLRGSSEDLEIANELLFDTESESFEEDFSDSVCPVCFGKPRDPIALRCEHSYCSCCFTRHCENPLREDQPIQCVGLGESCRYIPTLQELRSHLSESCFESIIETSFRDSVLADPESLSYCPTPRCEAVFAVSARQGELTCSVCKTPICTSYCRYSHEGMICNQAAQA
jgi:hypothetical protein